MHPYEKYFGKPDMSKIDTKNLHGIFDVYKNTSIKTHLFRMGLYLIGAGICFYAAHLSGVGDTVLVQIVEEEKKLQKKEERNKPFNISPTFDL